MTSLPRPATEHPGAPASLPLLGSRPYLIPLFVGLATFALYGGAVGFTFLNWDDMANVVENHHLLRLRPEDFKWMFTGSMVLDYKPVVWLSYALDRLIWGFDPAGYHLTNILLHAANALLVYAIASVLLRRSGDASRHGILNTVGAVLITLLFGVHPQRVESVVWISERKDVLYAFFYLLSVRSYIRWIDRNGTRRFLVFGLFNLFGVLAMLSKPMAVSLPVILLLLDLLVFRRFHFRSAIPVLAEKALLAAATVLVAGRTIGIHAADRSLGPVLPLAGTPIPGMSAGQTWLMFPSSILFYIRKTFWPVPLSPLYPLAEATPHRLAALAPGLVIVVATLVFLALCARGRRWPLFLWLFFLVSILPALPSRNVADRFTYLPSLGLIGMVVGAWLAFSRYLRVPNARVLLVALPAGAVLALSVLNWSYAGLWGNSESLWSYAVARTPSAKAYYFLSAARLSACEYRQALRTIESALELDPSMAGAWNAKGAILATLRRPVEAAACFENAIRIQRDLWEALENLGAVLDAQGNVPAARSNWLAALKINPSSFNSNVGLARSYAREGCAGEAAAYYNAALALWPSARWLEDEARVTAPAATPESPPPGAR
jgi:tetratricopeptide (TPR) repeat protein